MLRNCKTIRLTIMSKNCGDCVYRWSKHGYLHRDNDLPAMRETIANYFYINGVYVRHEWLDGFNLRPVRDL